MSGVKGKSGRRSCNQERDFQRLITKSYDYLFCNFEHFDEDKRFHLALEIIKRAMPTNLNMPTGELNLVINIHAPKTEQQDSDNTAGLVYGYRAQVSAVN